MAKANPALVEEVLTAARGAIADPELRAKLVPDAVDDIDEDHLRMRVDVFRKLPGLQRMVIGAHRAKASLGHPSPRTPEREARIEGVRTAALRYCVDAAAVDELMAVADRIDDAGLESLRTDLDKLALAQRKDLELLIEMDRRAEASAARAVAQDEAREVRATAQAARKEKYEQMKKELDEKMAAIRARQAERNSSPPGGLRPSSKSK